MKNRPIQQIFVVLVFLSCSFYAIWSSAGSPNSPPLSVSIIRDVLRDSPNGSTMELGSALVNKEQALTMAERVRVRKEMLLSYDAIATDIGRNDLLSLWDWAFFNGELKVGNFSWAREWLESRQVNSVNGVPIETLVANMGGISPNVSMRIFIDMARNTNDRSQAYAKDILFRSFKNILASNPESKTCNDNDLIAIESVLFSPGKKWKLDPDYQTRFETESLSREFTGNLLTPTP